MNIRIFIAFLLFLSVNNLYSQNAITEDKVKQIVSTATSKLNKLEQQYKKTKIKILKEQLRSLKSLLNTAIKNSDLESVNLINEEKTKVEKLLEEITGISIVKTKSTSISPPEPQETAVGNTITSKIVYIENMWQPGIISTKGSKVIFELNKNESINERWIMETNKDGETLIKTSEEPFKYLCAERSKLKLKSNLRRIKGHKWRIIEIEGYNQIQNIKDPSLYIHLHMQKRQIEVPPILHGWHSARWKFLEHQN